MTKDEILKRLAADPDPWVRCGVATQARPSLQHVLADDSHRVVRLALLENPNLSELVLERLTTDADAIVRLAAKDAR